LVYYGYRYYSPSLGRWIGRDPSGEIDNVALYGMLRNNSINSVDIDGRAAYPQIGTLSTVKAIYDISKLIKDKLMPVIKVGKWDPASRVLDSAAYSILFAVSAIADASNNILNGKGPDCTSNGFVDFSSGQLDAYDFVKHADSGYTVWADMDAVSLACDAAGPNTGGAANRWSLGQILAGGSGGLSGDDALVTWGVISTIEDAVQ
jgi:uncharacterized protein RhaS with RHS repeats